MRGARGGWARELGLTIAGYLALAVGLTWPVALTLGERYAGNRPLDIWVHTWSLWWVRYALTVVHTNPFVTTYLFYPDGTTLYLHTLTPLSGLMAIPAGLVWGVTVAYNTTALLALALAGVATYWLARRWCGPLGAGLAGLAFAGAPWVLHQLRVGHINLMNAGWLPLALLLLLRATDTGRWRDRLLAVLGLGAATLVDLHFALFLAVAGGVVAVERLATAGSSVALRQRAISLALVAGLYGLAVAPLALAVLTQGAAVPAADQAKFEREQVEYSADLLAYLVPQLLHPLWGRPVTAWLIAHPLGSVTEGRVSLSLTALLLAGLAVAWRRPGAWPWAAVGLVGLLLSLGPRLFVGGADTGLPGPYALLGGGPLLNLSRTPARFGVLVALAVALLAGLGLAAVHAASGRRWGGRLARGLTAALVLLVVVELLPVPYPTIPPPSLALAERVAAEAGAGTVLELPFRADDAPRMLYQTVHTRPVFSGYTARPAERPFLDRAPVLADLMRRADQPDIIAIDDPLAVLATYRITLIVVYRPPYYRPDEPDAPPVNEALLRRRVQQLLRVPGPTWENETGALYRVPPAAPVPVPALGPGWHAPEPWPGGWMRWLPAEAGLRLDRPHPAPVTLRFTAWSFHRPRALTVLLGGRPIGDLRVTPDPQRLAVTVPAGAGRADLTLRVVEGADTPAALGLNADPRPLAIGLADLRAEEEGPGAREGPFSP